MAAAPRLASTLLLLCLIFSSVLPGDAIPSFRSRCRCRVLSKHHVPRCSVQSLIMTPPASSCRVWQVIVRTIDGSEFCLDPRSTSFKVLMGQRNGRCPRNRKMRRRSAKNRP
uniref:C-X-C motif chemokine 3-like isoform X2 n=1 Tax=Myxine glutinosa TaxID=7769 RepID=UPI00358F2F31